jgi:hypothetical protein
MRPAKSGDDFSDYIWGHVRLESLARDPPQEVTNDLVSQRLSLTDGSYTRKWPQAKCVPLEKYLSSSFFF